MNITYRQLKNILSEMSDKELAMNVTVHTPDDEYYPVYAINWSKEKTCDVLDDKHPFLEINEGNIP